MNGGVGFRIQALHAYLAIHDDGDEGVIGVPTHVGIIPAIAADRTRLDELRPVVEKIAKAEGKRVKLVRFNNREVIEEIEP
jgi:hypothetical protein